MKPVALDLFCCGGGSTTGLQRAGFRVVGVDWKRQKSYRGDDFLERDLSAEAAVRAVIDEVHPDFISASPPCQQFSTATPTKNRMDHPNLIPSTRAAIIASGIPGWIENVHGAPLHNALRLCGTMFHATWGIKRHRYFECIGWYALEPEHRWCMYGPTEDVTWTDPLGVMATTVGSAERRDVESLHDGSEGSNSRASRVRRATTGVYGFVDAPGSERERRSVVSVVSVNGDNGSRGRGPRKKRSVVSLNNGDTVPPAFQHDRGHPKAVAHIGQNRPGPQCIRWRTALGWIDGPKNRYALAQAVPPAYAEFLGRSFLESR